MKIMLVLALLLALSFTACSPSEDTAPAEQTNAVVGENPLNAPAEYLGAAAKAKQSAVRTVDLAAVTRSIQMFQVSEGRYPKDLNELVTENYLPRLPALPAGMKYSYDANSGRVQSVPQ